MHLVANGGSEALAASMEGKTAVATVDVQSDGQFCVLHNFAGNMRNIRHPGVQGKENKTLPKLQSNLCIIVETGDTMAESKVLT
eukprot:1154611-Pelagomonas_calceolata.AAC.4